MINYDTLDYDNISFYRRKFYNVVIVNDKPIYQLDPLKIKTAEDKRQFRFLANLDKRTYNAGKRIKNIIEKYGSCYFVTLTFNDRHISKNEKTLTTYATRFMKDLGGSFIGNTDYGAKNNRFHLHFFIGLTQPILYNALNWKFGAVKFEPLRNTNDFKNIAKYITKLTRHALKNGNKSRLIYSRSVSS